MTSPENSKKVSLNVNCFTEKYKYLENLTSIMKSKYHESIIKIQSNLKVDKHDKKLSSIIAAYGVP